MGTIFELTKPVKQLSRRILRKKAYRVVFIIDRVEGSGGETSIHHDLGHVDPYIAREDLLTIEMLLDYAREVSRYPEVKRVTMTVKTRNNVYSFTVENGEIKRFESF